MEISRRAMLAGTAAVALVGCTSNPEPSTPVPGSSSAANPTEWSDPTPRWPLTGTPLASGDETKAAHSIVAIKIGQEPSSMPQWGISDADILISQPQGRSYDTTRLVAMYHSAYPKDGCQPCRSARPSDLSLLAPEKAVLASSGAYEWVVDMLKAAKDELTFVDTVGNPGAWWGTRNGNKWWYGVDKSWKSVVAYPDKMVALDKLNPGQIPAVYLQYAATDAEVSTVVGGTPATEAQNENIGRTNMSEIHRFQYDEGTKKYKVSLKWPNGPKWEGVSGVDTKWHNWVDNEKKQVTRDNVLIIVANWEMGISEGVTATHKEPIVKLDGKDGHFFYLNQGKVVEGTWSKASTDAPFRFKLDDGTFLKMAPGQTWIELAKAQKYVTVS